MNGIRHFRAGRRQLGNLALATWVWLVLGLLAAYNWSAGLRPPQSVRSRSRAQTLVEWSLAAAVLAFVGIAAWQVAGTAITDAINRTVGSLNRAGA